MLFHPDCNYAFKHAGRDIMHMAEKANSLAPEQYGSRKHHRAIAVNKVLTNHILCQLKRPGVICSNDSKSCSDLIGHAQASLAMQRNGVSKTAIDCLFSTLQGATHQVRTGFGDSAIYYRGDKWLIPLHSIGQGNGAGPAIWAVVSTPLLNILCKKGFGCEIINPISGEKYKFLGYAFVDDTDLVESKAGCFDAGQLLHSMQQSLNTWEGTLKATCGTIVPEKTFR